MCRGYCVGFSFVLAIMALSIAMLLYSPKYDAPLMDPKERWGPYGSPEPGAQSAVKQFQIPNSPDEITRLRNRLSEPLQLAEPLEDVKFQYGFAKNKLEELIKYWRDDYLPKWDERVKFLNAIPQFTTEIQGLKIHFIHTKQLTEKAKYVVPLLLLHGWPGSVREFYEIIPKLTKANDDYAFVVVAPSLPGYGFSSGATKPGLNPTKVAVIMNSLMTSLGYNRYLVQGGDWGSIIGSAVATLYPKNVIAYHSNMCTSGRYTSFVKDYIASFYPSLFVDEEYVDFHFPIKNQFMFIVRESGYFHLQATKPDTIGAALTANPVGLAAYILEKFSTWTDKNNPNLIDGGLDKAFKKEALFDNLMIYYLSNSITTSMRLYAEAFSINHMEYGMEKVPAVVPFGCARFRHDLKHELDWQLRDKFPQLMHSTYHNTGGHFAAMELPDVLYKDFHQFVKKLDPKSFK